MIKISVIIPCYNASKDLGRCVDSILFAQIEELPVEIILVNDGSTDDTLKICHEYETLFNNVCVISQINKGLSVARNLGLNKAKGEYIAFVDSDDYVEENYFDALLETIEEEYKVIQFGYNRVENYNKTKIPIDKQTINRSNLIDQIVNSTENKILWFVWRRIYKRDFLEKNNIIFDEEIRYGEDSVFSLKVFRTLENLVTISENIYNYVENENSLTQVKYKQNLLAKFEIQYAKRYEIKFDDIEHELLLKDIAKNYIDHTLFAILNNIRNSSGTHKREELIKTRESVIYKETFKNYKYTWGYPRRSLMIKLFELKLYKLLLKLI